MRKNNIKKIWRDGGAAVNGWLAIPSSVSAETMAHEAWDSLTIDLFSYLLKSLQQLQTKFLILKEL